MQDFLVNCDTSTIHGSERYRVWSDGLCQTFGPLQFQPAPGFGFFGSLKMRARGGLRFNTLRYSGQRVQRHSRDVRQLTQNFFTFTCPFAGRLEVEHDRSVRLLTPDHVYLFNHATPYSAVPLDEYQTVSVSLPESGLRQRMPRLRAFYSLPSSASNVRAELVKSFGNHLATGLNEWSSSEYAELTEKFLDLIALAFGQGADTSESCDSSVRSAHLIAARACIRSLAGEATLSPARIAQACRISTSYLHQIFRGSGQTVEELIVSERLDQARALLSNPRFSNTAVSTIAYLSGFTHPSHFSRSFKKRFGVSPRESREFVRGTA